MNIQVEWVEGFDPIPLIEIEGMGDICAKHAVEELKIQSHKDAAKLDEAKDKCYQEAFNKGIMKVGDFAGMKCEEAKPLVRKQMIDAGDAVPYYEPEKPVTARTGEPCIVALCDQWLLDYGEDQWKEKVREHVSSDRFNCYNPKTQKEFDDILDWLKEWGCSRTTGLGTRVPWDEQFVIESLSDSTIYFAYYTIAHLLQGENNLEGTEIGPLGVPAEAFTIEAFNYVFMDAAYDAEKCPGVTEEQLKKLRHEFNYWYPMDLGVSGKDLIRNHLTMSLYNHQAIWEDNEKRATRSYFCNGYLCLNGKKMSKSTGNFMTLNECIKKFGSEASRFALCDAGDTLDDANFEVETANAAIMKLFVLEGWIQSNMPQEPLDHAADDKASYTLWDNLLENEINMALNKAFKSYEEMKFKNVVVIFNHLIRIKESYLIARGGEKNNFVIARFIEAILTIMNPVTPHWCQNVWQKFVFTPLSQSSNRSKPVNEMLISNGWPQAPEGDKLLSEKLNYVEGVKREVRLGLDKAMSGGKKKGKGGKNAAAAEPAPAKENCIVVVGTEYPEFQQAVLQVLQSQQFDDDGVIIGKDYIAQVRSVVTDKKQQGIAMKFAAFVLEKVPESGKESALQLSSSFDEKELIEENQSFIFENMPTVKNIKIVLKTDASIDEVATARQIADSAVPGKPSIIFH